MIKDPASQFAGDPVSILENAEMGIIQLDRSFRIAYANPAAARFLGIDRQALTGRLICDAFPEGTDKEFLGALKQSFEQGVRVSLDVHYTFTEDLWLNCRSKPSGEGFTIVLENVTARKQAQEEAARLFHQAEEEREKLQVILNSIADEVWFLDAENNIALLNPAVRKGLGIKTKSEDTLEGILGALEVMNPDGSPRPVEEAPLRRSLEGVNVSGDEMIRNQKTGEMRYRHYHTSPVRDRNGSILGAVGVVNDVTESRKMEKALQESEERYHSLFENNHAAILLMEPATGRILDANPAACDYYGYTREKLTSLNITDINVLAREQVLREMNRAVTEQRRHFIFRHRLASGEVRDVEVYSGPVTVSGETLLYSMVHDITERTKAEAEIRRLNEALEEKVETRTRELAKTVDRLNEQKELLKAIVDTIPVMLTVYGQDGKVRLVNREFERLVGWTVEEALNMDIIEAVYKGPLDRDTAWTALTEAGSGWKDRDIVTRWGKTLHTSWANKRLSDGTIIGIGIDISQRRKMEQDLLRLAAAIEQAGEGIALFSPEGVIEYMNPADEALNGYVPGELVGGPLTLLGEDVYASYQEIFKSVRESGTPWTGHQKRKCKDGEICEVSLSVAPVRDEAGRIITFVSVVRDITRETELQNQLSQTRKMEAIGNLAGGIAHDLKNIFMPILLNTELAMEDVGEDDPRHELLREVLDAAKLGKELVQQVLTFSRRTALKRLPVNIPAVIEETTSFLRTMLPPDIEIHEQIKDDRVMACADPTQIKQVLINLGSNAGHAMQEGGGTLDIIEASTVLDEEDALTISPDLSPGPYIRITVRDTGYGMDRETIEHIFEPFFTTKKGEGTGMGLAVAHGIVKDHRGAITVRSEPGLGTTFTILLPGMREEGGKEGCTPAAAR